MTWWQILITIVGGIIALRVSMNFDINRWMEQKRRNQEERLPYLCTHVRMSPQPEGTLSVQSLFISPYGTTQYTCSRCGFWVIEAGTAHRISAEYWSDPAKRHEYIKREKAFEKAVKKLGRA